MTERIRILKMNREKNVKKEEIPVRDRSYRLAIIEHPKSSVKIQYAYGFAYTLREKSIKIQKEDILAGFLYQYTYNVNFPMKVSEDFDPAGRASFRMDTQREVEEYFKLFSTSPDSPQGGELLEFLNGTEAWLFKHWHSGHVLAGYTMLLEKGFGGLLREVSEEQKKCTIQEEKDTLNAFRIVLKACMEYVERYEKLARELAEAATDEEERLRLLGIRDILAGIKSEPPGTFAQAIQLVWLSHEMMYCENVPSAISIGRLDQYLYPYYCRDVKAGILNNEQAEEYIQAFFLKCSSLKKAYQNLTVGGCDAKGRCAVNPLTYFCINATKELKLDQPSLTYRWTDDMPQEAWEAVLDLIREGMGFPALAYDKCYMKAMEDNGILPEDCYDYSLLGCVEPAIQGKEYALTEMLRLNLPKILNLMLSGGKDMKTGKVFTLKSRKHLDKINCYEKLWKWYLEEIEYFTEMGIRNSQRCEVLYEKRYPLPYLSVLMKDCIQRRRDVSEGGAIYNSVGINICGVATAADSLMAVKQLVFEEKQLTLMEYADILMKDFEGAEELRQRAVKHCPKYGNDLEEPDMAAAEIIACIRRKIKKYKTYHGGNYRLGLYSVEDHAIMGSATGATADGRKSGVSLSNSMGAVQGMDKNGPTSLLNTVTHTDMSVAANGMVLDIKFIPSFLDQETGKKALRHLIRTYFRNGGMEIQISLVSKDTLLAAQADPENFKDLIVRVSGFSAYFVTLRRETQDEIIQRTECG